MPIPPRRMAMVRVMLLYFSRMGETLLQLFLRGRVR